MQVVSAVRHDMCVPEGRALSWGPGKRSLPWSCFLPSDHTEEDVVAARGVVEPVSFKKLLGS